MNFFKKIFTKKASRSAANTGLDNKKFEYNRDIVEKRLKDIQILTDKQQKRILIEQGDTSNDFIMDLTKWGMQASDKKQFEAAIGYRLRGNQLVIEFNDINHATQTLAFLPTSPSVNRAAIPFEKSAVVLLFGKWGWEERIRIAKGCQENGGIILFMTQARDEFI